VSAHAIAVVEAELFDVGLAEGISGARLKSILDSQVDF